jgi:hypothetical protein
MVVKRIVGCCKRYGMLRSEVFEGVRVSKQLLDRCVDSFKKSYGILVPKNSTFDVSEIPFYFQSWAEGSYY